ncbi:hypothetical protein B6U80_00255 [Candidatus Pacearchaeota archaeon ex4484_26]|nr:MAG: hypothetical protein B6U80_00255 [Candidatus Pacearchaeota archaeon ex4484_26]
MTGKIGVNIIIEREKQNGKVVFIASSPDVNVFAEGKTIDEAKRKFIEGVKIHLKTFPEEKASLIKEQKEQEYEMPLVTKVFL